MERKRVMTGYYVVVVFLGWLVALLWMLHISDQRELDEAYQFIEVQGKLLDSCRRDMKSLRDELEFKSMAEKLEGKLNENKK